MGLTGKAGKRPAAGRNITLTGFMGTGKSAVGMRLAARLGLKFLDIDSLIEKETGSTIMEIFRRDGEKGFRALESEVIGKLTSGAYGTGLVVSTGGGAVVDPRSRAALKAWSTLVCLTAPMEDIVERVSRNEQRPMLDSRDKRARVEELMRQREGAYRDSHIMVDTGSMDVDGVVARIEKALAERRPEGE
ncbi:MAG: shikimate kinase [Thermodesulfobacteriota bacterium]